MDAYTETQNFEIANHDIMEFLLVREQYHGFDDTLNNYFKELNAPLSDPHYLNDCCFVEAVVQL